MIRGVNSIACLARIEVSGDDCEVMEMNLVGETAWRVKSGPI
jgi:hypothetical protein